MRALVFAALAKSKSVIKNPLISPDTLAMIEALRAFGCEIKINEAITVFPKPLRPPEKPIDAKNSGIVYRFIKAFELLVGAPINVFGDHSIQTRRPITPLIDGIKQIQNDEITVDGADSQPVSALLIALSLYPKPKILKVKNPGEKPWVDLTLDWLNRLNINFERDGYHTFRLYGNARFDGFNYTVPNDMSSACFPYALKLLNHDIEFENFSPDPIQGDEKFLQMNPLDGGVFEINAMVDTLPILSVLGCFAKQPLEIRGAKIARYKESDRIACMVKELRKMGGHLEEFEDGLKVYPAKLYGADLNSHQDHRIAMSLIVASLNAGSPSTITGLECIQKTYPTFLQEIQKCSNPLQCVK